MSLYADIKTKKLNFHLDESELLCKNGCGFYGNPAWQGYCSKCYREVYQREQTSNRRSFGLNRSSTEPASHSSVPLAFSKFEEKKKQQAEKRKKTVKSIFKKSNQLTEQYSGSSWAEQRQTSFESQQVTKEFSDFLKTLSKPAAQDISRQIELFIDKVHKNSHLATEDIGYLVQDFYGAMTERLESHQIFQGSTTEVIEKLMSYTEKYLMTKLYKTIFIPVSTEDEDEDLKIQKRIRSLNWISAQHLDTGINDKHPEARDLIDKAITDIIEMDSKRAPLDKLHCIVRCSKHIFNILRLCCGAPVSADDFLPALIYVVCCAVAYIENLNAESLNLSEFEYERYMSGEAIPSGDYEQTVFMCEGLRLMYQNLATISEMKQRLDKLMENTQSLKNEMTDFKESIKNEVIALIARNPLTIRKKSLPTSIDDVDESDNAQLPMPLQPEILMDLPNNNAVSSTSESPPNLL
ncbi:Rab5 GDP/GTP exchange factor [Nymphon striatum]|nr:Rab5 GDP/GTP exchange factor [Nymphon striatum]